MISSMRFLLSQTPLHVTRAFPHKVSSRNFTQKFTSYDILALDFDGVLCASSGESSYTGVAAAVDLWSLHKGEQEEFSLRFDEAVSDVINVRPVIETGYENVLLARYFLECRKSKSRIVCDTTANRVLKEYNTTFRDDLLQRYGEPKEKLIHAFASKRDNLIAKDLDGWIRRNQIYPHIFEATSHLHLPPEDESLEKKLKQLYIVTTKQERFVQSILRTFKIPLYRHGLSHTIMDSRTFIGDDWFTKTSNIFDLENIYGSKLNVLKELSNRVATMSLQQSQSTIHFVEDRYETLLAIIFAAGQDSSINVLAETAGIPPSNDKLNVKLYLADWGYNTLAQKEAAAKNPLITIISPDKFVHMMHEFTS